MDIPTIGLETSTMVTDQSWENSTDRVSAQVQLRMYDIFIPILGIVIIVLNLAVVISSGLILKKGQQPRSTYLFLGNVALTDLLTGFAVLFGQFYPKAHRGEISCAFQLGMIVSATITSIYSVGLIAVDRYLYILYGMQYQRYIYPTRARLMILATWIIGIVIGFLPAMGWRGDTDHGRICWFIVMAPPELIILTSIVGVIPLLLIIVLYSIILYYALSRVVQLKKAAERTDGGVSLSGNLRIFTGGRAYNVNNSNATVPVTEETEQPLTRRRWIKFFKKDPKVNENVHLNTGQSPSKWKAIKVVLFTTGSFIITWVPYFIACTWYVNCDQNATPDLCNNLRIAIAAPLAILGFANSLFNPIIYAWWHNGFRESVKRMYFKARSKKPTPNSRNAVASPSTSIYTANTSSGSGNAARPIEQSDTETLDSENDSNEIRKVHLEQLVVSQIPNAIQDSDTHIQQDTKNGITNDSYMKDQNISEHSK